MQGTGILATNTASDGTPTGVEGVVPNASGGYGLSTPHDARVDGKLAAGRRPRGQGFQLFFNLVFDPVYD
jgi:hypothetical protein